MKFTASAVLSGLLLAAGLSVAQAQTATPAAPASPATPAAQATPSKSVADQTMGRDHMMTKREADAAYADAKRHCKALSGDERAACMKQARADHKQWKETTHKDAPR